MSGFAKLGEEVRWRGRIGTVRVERFRHADGSEVEREVVAHPGAVAILAVDDQHVWLVRQPREIVGETTLEIPAGKYDVEDEDPLDTGRRELAEEIGKAADHWERVCSFWSSPGFTDERIDVWLASALRDAPGHAVPDERIDVVPWPLDRLEAAIAECRDAKSLVALQWLARRRAAG
jgi:8-oxo-dGTP pyrophosphatase MutT (NUDIX family)